MRPPASRFLQASMAALSLVLWTSPAHARPPWFDGGGRGDRGPLELVRMWRLVDELGIDESQAARVFPAFRRHRVARQDLVAQRQELLKTLRQQLSEGAEEEDLRASVDRARALDGRIQELDAAFEVELAGLLSTEQEARLLLFDLSFRQDLREVVRRLRDAGPGGPRRGPWSP